MSGTGEKNDPRPKDWEPGWGDRILVSIRRAGYPSATAFADSAPGATFKQLVAKLDTRYAPVQLESVLGDEAIDRGELTRFARRLLVEHLRTKMPKGWGLGTNPEFERAHVFGAWSADLSRLEKRSAVDQVLDRLKASEPPPGWIPASTDDPILVSAFDGVSFETTDPEVIKRLRGE